MREQKYHLYLSDSERSFAIQNLIWFQNKLRQEGRYGNENADSAAAARTD